LRVIFERVEPLCIGAVTFYTAKLGTNTETEFGSFTENDFPDHVREIQILYQVISRMHNRGAKLYYFKNEKNAEALPIVTSNVMKANKKDFGIRLYCIFLNESEVILLNGGIKTKKKPQDCPNVKDHFRIANKIAVALYSHLADPDKRKDCLTDNVLSI